MTNEKRDGSVASRFNEENLVRVAPGIWEDKKTGRRVSGGTYEPDTGVGKLMRRALQEGEAPEELVEAQEELEEAEESETEATEE